jgi:GAF domain
MAEQGVVTRALLSMARVDVRERTLAEHLCRACVDGLDVHGASLSLLTSSPSRETLWATDPTAELLEELQFSLNEGACMEAAVSGSPVLVPDLSDSAEGHRWPIFAAAVAEQTDVVALFALPLQWGTINLGVLDLYRRTPGGLSQAQWRDALSAADIAALMMLGVRTEPDDGSGGEGLDPAVNSRAEVHQATGMVLAQLEVSAEVALARIRAYAFVEQRLLIDVARDVVSRRLRFTDDMA